MRGCGGRTRQLSGDGLSAQLLVSGSPFQDTPLFYWHREARNANAEVDDRCPSISRAR